MGLQGIVIFPASTQIWIFKKCGSQSSWQKRCLKSTRSARNINVYTSKCKKQVTSMHFQINSGRWWLWTPRTTRCGRVFWDRIPCKQGGLQSLIDNRDLLDFPGAISYFCTFIYKSKLFFKSFKQVKTELQTLKQVAVSYTFKQNLICNKWKKLKKTRHLGTEVQK